MFKNVELKNDRQTRLAVAGISTLLAVLSLQGDVSESTANTPCHTETPVTSPTYIDIYDDQLAVLTEPQKDGDGYSIRVWPNSNGYDIISPDGSVDLELKKSDSTNGTYVGSLQTKNGVVTIGYNPSKSTINSICAVVPQDSE